MHCSDGRTEVAVRPEAVAAVKPPEAELKKLFVGPFGLRSAEVTLKRPLRWTTAPSMLPLSFFWRYCSGPL
nr:hypothetical protein Iba_chr02aCG1050 [Ipomoea batatas]GMC59362.1 hypothetical protein Iba_chr02bCG0580 [Ipomoea batatas]GMC62091.1 hypothetical protein Iba_chr02cCG0590 [Ipomoea batatas]GMC67226.1 hypothetical protein Iba_chr02fCG0550 [Ipomoea batatas]GME06999.1 hypothetical protein Iba_scaffold5767CG0640 [Ipomoea batatas]